MEEASQSTKELDEDHIRHRAYMLWLEDGQPDGKAEEHCHQARAVTEAERDKSAPAAKPIRKRK
ncbi:DUF2934 domain-containing protein [Rhizobium sp. YK2]|uniref:DUF2934 domain-containing protein n=1 Tax=Rhizobium sp. YK2 TaxID=1860096 RepID=UPI00084BDBDD|nr:DUF2934 domain-containing protein [Rhizobium sp. YK2]OEC93405.1 hypothetical protein A9Z06_09575 [Rhizobium sp. YK2]